MLKHNCTNGTTNTPQISTMPIHCWNTLDFLSSQMGIVLFPNISTLNSFLETEICQNEEFSICYTFERENLIKSGTKTVLPAVSKNCCAWVFFLFILPIHLLLPLQKFRCIVWLMRKQWKFMPTLIAILLPSRQTTQLHHGAFIEEKPKHCTIASFYSFALRGLLHKQIVLMTQTTPSSSSSIGQKNGYIFFLLYCVLATTKTIVQISYNTTWNSTNAPYTIIEFKIYNTTNHI